MKNGKLWRSVIYFLAVGLLIFLLIYLRTVGNSVNYFFQEIRVSVYSRLSFIGSFISEIKTLKKLTEENIQLKKEKQSLISSLANQEKLKEENIFLRESLELGFIQETRSLIVGIFNLESTPRGHTLLINKGQKDGIKKDDVITSSSGVLIGIVDRPFENYSRVITVTNLNFKTTVKVIFKNTSGIAIGSMGEGIYLDFISENDDVVEGDIVITTDNDIFPPGLIVGKIVQISSSNGGLFKNVRVKPAMEEINLSQALVLLK